MGEVEDPPSREAFAALRGHAAIFPLESRALLAARGEDRTSFLQGMLSNDVARLSAGHGIHALLLTEQGRVVAELLVLALEGELRLDVAHAGREQVQSALDRFIVADDVEITPEPHVAVALLGPRAVDVLAAAGGSSETDIRELGECAHATVAIGGVSAWVVRAHDLGLDGFRIWVQPDERDQVLAALESAGAARIDGATIEAQRIAAGSPREGVDFDEQTLAPEVPALARAISHRKGCYLGQEVVERVAARGHVNWLLSGLRASTGTFARGAVVLQDGSEVGRVTSAAVRPDDGACVGLARLRRSAAEPGTRVTVRGEEGEVAAEVAQVEGA